MILAEVFLGNNVIIVDNQIVDSVIQGNREAMQELYSLTVRYLYAICHRYIVNDEDTRDVLQETYIKVFKSIKDFSAKHDTSVLSWMTRIAVNESLMHLRRKQRTTFIEVVETIPEREEELEVSRFSPDELHNAIRLLPTGYRIVLNLYVFEEKSHREIAQMLGIKESSSASQLNRAKNQLRKILLAQEGGNR